MMHLVLVSDRKYRVQNLSMTVRDITDIGWL